MSPNDQSSEAPALDLEPALIRRVSAFLSYIVSRLSPAPPRREAGTIAATARPVNGVRLTATNSLEAEP